MDSDLAGATGVAEIHSNPAFPTAAPPVPSPWHVRCLLSTYALIYQQCLQTPHYPCFNYPVPLRLRSAKPSSFLLPPRSYYLSFLSSLLFSELLKLMCRGWDLGHRVNYLSRCCNKIPNKTPLGRKSFMVPGSTVGLSCLARYGNRSRGGWSHVHS